ncbi:hypothetical protein [Planococcus sp. YIM B11945]|uniref:hypothetical protein n=1 Tax=Planococcus sp. YIM B11945 TaxID=3435410 RepID=UPI003D7DEE6A
MNEKVQLFVKVDSQGNIKEEYSGRNIVMTEPQHYCFIVDEAVANNVVQYKVLIDEEMVPQLVLKESAE